MAPANSVPFDSSGDPAPTTPTVLPGLGGPDHQATLQTTEPLATGSGGPQPVSQEELNAWRRGFTLQAEIWNGRLAMLGLSIGLTVLLLVRLASQHG
jgi:hypothetical protein